MKLHSAEKDFASNSSAHTLSMPQIHPILWNFLCLFLIYMDLIWALIQLWAAAQEFFLDILKHFLAQRHHHPFYFRHIYRVF